MRRDHSAELIGISPAMQELRDEIARVAKSEAKILVTGESGVGKELVARAIHAQSPRASSAFVAMNCAGLPESLLESELFGHVKGSFTGAYRDKAGKLELADRGTLFLDEVGEMTPRMQGLLLRFLETGELQRVGSDAATGRVNVRVIAATNRDPHVLVTEGKFREDLFYRLNVIHLLVPSLRERHSDVPLLVEYFLGRFGRANAALNANGNGSAYHNKGDNGSEPARTSWSLDPAAMTALIEYPWPGNVRELENVIERIVVNARGELVGVDDLPPEIRQQRSVSLRPKRERRRSVADDLYKSMRDEHTSFWTTVYPLYMQREITKEHVRDLVRKGLTESRGNYRIVARLFNLDPGDYKRFLNFLRNHDCRLPFNEYRQ
jgi:transcriptional regulator with GAF, ATPase, and Fis domain